MPDQVVRYTPQKARAALPLVQRIVQDVVETYKDLESEVAGGAEITLRGLRINLGRGRGGLKHEPSETQRLLEAYIDELHSLGIEVLDPKQGLIVFHSERKGEPVYLCWALGQPTVTHWYSINESYAARRPIDWGEVASPAAK
jgi:hypothetical protein